MLFLISVFFIIIVFGNGFYGFCRAFDHAFGGFVGDFDRHSNDFMYAPLQKQTSDGDGNQSSDFHNVFRTNKNAIITKIN